jgi:phosphoglycolate phosphatase
MIKSVVFDFDGVLADSFEFHRERVGKFIGCDLSIQEYKDIHNGNFFDEDLNKKFKGVNWQDYRDLIYDEQIVWDLDENIREVVKFLSNNYDLSIITSAGTRNIEGCLGHNSLSDCFQDILGAESSVLKTDRFKYLFKKYNLVPDDFIFVTDTLGDIKEANEVDVKSIAVDFGFHDKETLKKGNPLKIISNFNEISDIIKEIS